MAYAATIPGGYNSAFDPREGRRGRRGHALGPTFDPLGLGDDLLLWWDPSTLEPGDIASWNDRKQNRQLIIAGTGTPPSYDGSMVVITSTAWLFGGNAGNGIAPPFEVWQVVDQHDPAGSGTRVSFATGSGSSLVQLEYTAPIGGQLSANIAGTTVFGGDNYHGIHVIRWSIGAASTFGYLDRKLGVPASVSATAPIPDNGLFLGRDTQAASPWLGRIGDTVVTKPLSDAEITAMWAYLTRRAGI